MLTRCPSCGKFMPYEGRDLYDDYDSLLCPECKAGSQAEKEIRASLTKWAEGKAIPYRDAWTMVYKEYQDRTGVNPWKGISTGMDNILRQTGSLDELRAIVDELTFRPEA